MDEHQAQTLADIDRFGWTVFKVSNDRGPDFAYSVGLFRTLSHPEIVMFGLPLDMMHQIINDVGDLARTGTRFVAGQITDKFLEGYDVTFRAVPECQYAGHFGWANWLYRGADYPVLQMVYPDMQRRYPWQDGVTASFRDGQPVLADIAVPDWAR